MARSVGKKVQAEKKAASRPAKKVAPKGVAKPPAAKVPVVKTKIKAKPRVTPKAAPAVSKPERKAAPKAEAGAAAARKATAKKTLSRGELQRFREQLLTKQRDLLEAYTNAKGDSRSRASDGTEDYIDYAVSSYDREFLLSLTELEQTELTLVQEALTRITRNQYGNCTQCEQPIPVKRLEVQPWAKYCLRCQEAAEQGRGQDVVEAPLDDEIEVPYEEGLEEEADYEEDEVDPDEDPPDAHDEDRMIGS